MINVYTSPEIERLPGIRHGFVGREGGVSSGSYASLNISGRVGDEPESVLKNKELLRKEIGRPLFFLDQIHSDTIVMLTEPEDRGLMEADAVITDLAGVALTILTADCLPILVVDPVKKVIGAIHAGLRGTLLEISSKTLSRMMKEYNTKVSDLHAVIGPGIGACCYKLESRRLTDEQRIKYSACCQQADSADHMYFDLRAANSQQLTTAGLNRISHLDYCTYHHQDKFYSYRAGKGVTGRFASFVMLV